MALRVLTGSLLGMGAPPAPAAPTPPPAADTALDRLIHQYIALYRRDSLERWQQLFRPGFTASFTNEDGSVTTLTFEQFLERQRRGFARTRDMGEVLENVRTDRTGRLASVWADFIFTADGVSRRGRLVLLCIEDRGEWKIQSLLFSYHRPAGDAFREAGPGTFIRRKL